MPIAIGGAVRGWADNPAQCLATNRARWSDHPNDQRCTSGLYGHLLDPSPRVDGNGNRFAYRGSDWDQHRRGVFVERFHLPTRPDECLGDAPLGVRHRWRLRRRWPPFLSAL